MECVVGRLLVICFCVSSVLAASYNTCRIMPFDRQIYHRRVQKEASWGGVARYILRYPEVLIDRDAIAAPKVISCIRCQDLQSVVQRENSVCKVVAGGVGHTFVTLLILSKPNAGYDYDVKIMGH